MSGVGEVVEHVAILLAEGADRGEDALREAFALRDTRTRVPGAEAADAAEDGTARSPLGAVIGGLDPGGDVSYGDCSYRAVRV